MNYKNMSENPPYELAVMDHGTYMATQCVSEWSVIPGWHLHNCMYDVMHNLFLGTARDFIASSVRVLLEKGFFDKPGVERGSETMFQHITLGIHEMFRKHKFLEWSWQVLLTDVSVLFLLLFEGIFHLSKTYVDIWSMHLVFDGACGVRPRLSYWGPGIIKKHCFPISKDQKFAELGSKFKASHTKSLLWWLAAVTAQAFNASPYVPEQ